MSPHAGQPGPGRTQEQAVRLLRERGQSVATAESLTAGLISASLAEVPGASAVLRGGVVSYAAEVKEALLGVDPELIIGAGTDAVTRVTIDSADDRGAAWSTVGVSPNIVDASFEALVEAIRWKLIRDGAA